MKRLFAVAAVLALVAPVGQVFAAETIVGKIAATDPAQCSFTLRGEGAFYQSNQEPGFCADLKIGEVVAVTFDRSGGTNNVLSVAPFEQQHEVGIVAAVTDDSLILTSGAEFALNDLGPSRLTLPDVKEGDQVLVEYAMTGGKNLAVHVDDLSITSGN
jgi:hypothetical protein